MKKALVLFGLFVAVSSSAFAAEYKIDPDHSSVGFKIKHLAISSVSGRFTEVSGNFSFDPKNISAAKADAVIKVKSLNTEVAKRDTHLKSPEFFDESKFPSMTFKTTKVEPVSDTEFNATGDLTIHGVTKPATLNVVFQGEAKDPWGNERAGFVATTKINRADYGLTWNKTLETGGLLVGEVADVTLEIEGIKQK